MTEQSDFDPFKMEFEFAADDKIDHDCYELIQRTFQMSDEQIQTMFISEETTLHDFESALDDYVPIEETTGHRLIRLTEVPSSERHHYRHFRNPERMLVWYPPISDEESQEIEQQSRRQLLTKVEQTYNISVKDFPSNEELFIWKVAQFIRQKRIAQLKNN